MNLNLQTGLKLCKALDSGGPDALQPFEVRALFNIAMTLDIHAETTSEICGKLSTLFDELQHAMDKVENKHPALHKLLRYLGMSLIFAIRVESCKQQATAVHPNQMATSTTTAQCEVRLLQRNPELGRFSDARYFAVENEDIRGDAAAFADDLDIIKGVWNAILKNRHHGRQIYKTATFILGDSGAGKGTVTRQIIQNNKNLKQGTWGALYFNTDDVMELLPGYTSLLKMGSMKGVPISDMDAAAIYHEPAKAIASLLRKRALELGESIIFDGTGSNIKKLERMIKTFKEEGYIVNVIAVAAPANIRQGRVASRAVHTGRFVPPWVVQKRRSKGQWDMYLTDLKK